MAGASVLDLGAVQDNCCGDPPSFTFTELIDAADPAAVALDIPNAANPNSSPSVGVTDGATLSWTNVGAWNNAPDAASNTAGGSYFLRRSTADPLIPSTFTVAGANAGDVISVDFVGSDGRDADVTVAGVTTNVPQYVLGTSVWTNVGTGTGSLTGSFDLGLVQGDDPNFEANLGAIRVTITPVPEPAGLALLGLGAAAFLFLRRKR